MLSTKSSSSPMLLNTLRYGAVACCGLVFALILGDATRDQPSVLLFFENSLFNLYNPLYLSIEQCFCTCREAMRYGSSPRCCSCFCLELQLATIPEAGRPQMKWTQAVCFASTFIHFRGTQNFGKHCTDATMQLCLGRMVRC